MSNAVSGWQDRVLLSQSAAKRAGIMCFFRCKRYVVLKSTHVPSLTSGSFIILLFSSIRFSFSNSGLSLAMNLFLWDFPKEWLTAFLGNMFSPNRGTEVYVYAQLNPLVTLIKVMTARLTRRRFASIPEQSSGNQRKSSYSWKTFLGPKQHGVCSVVSSNLIC